MTEEIPAQGRKRARWMKKVIFLVVLIILVAVCYYGPGIWMSWQVKGYQAVFLTNGQVYFGKLSASGSWLELSDIYYLQVTQALQQASSTDQAKTVPPTGTADPNSQPNIQLIKLGSELHGPNDVMYIERDKVVFWENMKDDSKVMSAIKQYKSK